MSLNPRLMKRVIFSLSFYLLLLLSLKAQYNSLETFTSSNGLANNGCSALCIESDGTLWLGHDFFGQPSLNGKPISRRLPNGSWDYPFNTSGLATPTVNGNPYSWASFAVKEIYQSSDSSIWFLATSGNASDMNSAPPLLAYKNGSFTVYHISLNNFPNKGSIHSIVNDANGNLWFGAEEGLIKYDLANSQFSAYNPPVVNFGVPHASNHNSKRVFSLDYDSQGNILLLTGIPTSINGPKSLLRIFDPINLTWQYWTHEDAPWWNATQVTYAPVDIQASRDKDDRVWLSTNGGGIYWIDNRNWSSHQLNQIGDFLRGWSHPNFTFDHIYTNLPDFTSNLYQDPDGDLWIIGSSGGDKNVYTHKYQQPTTYGGNAATQHLYGYKHCSILYNNNGSMDPSPYQDMVFHKNEIWLAARHGLEHYYYDSLNPPPACIGLKGARNYKGVAGFNTKSNNVLEPARTGHVVPGNWPGISVDTSYYYLSTTDYENIYPTVDAGIVGNGFADGFPATAAALANAGLSFNDISLRFSAISLDLDKKGTNWDYTDSLETRTYSEWFSLNGNGDLQSESHFEILVGNQVIFKGRMPDFHLKIRYNRYGYLFDSIGGYTDPAPLIPHPNITDPDAADIKDSILSDLQGNGVSFIFRTIQLALDESIKNADRRGGVFRVFDAYLRKENMPASEAPMPMCGDYTIGQTVNADYPSFSSAAADLQLRGIACDVRFLIGKGTYNEQFSLSEIEGNEIYKITFDGQEHNALVEFNPSHIDSNYIVQVKGTNDLSFLGLSFKNTSASFGKVFELNGSTLNFRLTNCVLNGKQNAANSPSSTANLYTLFACADADSLLIENCQFEDGSHALDLNGDYIQVINNQFEGNTGTAIDLNSGADGMVKDNRILGPSNGSFKGITASGHPVQLLNNQVLNNSANCTGAIALTYFGVPDAGDTIIVANNEVSVQLGVNQTALLSYCDQVKLLHNSIHVLGNNSGSNALLNFGQEGAWISRNNIISNPNGCCFFSARSDAGDPYGDADYNLYFSNSNSAFKTITGFGAETSYANLAAFKTATGADANSIALDPQFANTDHLLPLNNAADGLGTPLSEFSSDRLGRRRDLNNPDQGCYEFDGVGWTGANSSDWNDPLNWSDQKVPTSLSKVFISPQNNNPNIDASVEVKEFIMHHRANLHIEANSGLKVDSFLQNSGEIVLEADTNGNYARLIQNKISGAGTIRQEAVLRAPDTIIRWFHLGVPVRTKISDLANANTHITAGSSGASIYFWNAFSGSWESPEDTAAWLEPGRGYAVAAGRNNYGDFLCSSFPAKIDVSGDLIAADSLLHLDLDYTNSPSFNSYVSQISDGWNFLANPYHSVYDMQNQNLPGTYKTIYVWNGTTYKQYNTHLDIGDDEARYLAPLQGFFLRTDSAQAAQGFDFDPAQRVLNSTQGIQKKAMPQFELHLRGGIHKQEDHCYFMIHDQALEAFELNKDAAKLPNAPDFPNLYSYAQEKEVAINVLPEAPLLQGIKIGFEASEDTTFAISLGENSLEKYEFYLEDKLMDKLWPLHLAPYQFSHQSYYPQDRFTLILRKNTVDLKDDQSQDIYLHVEDEIIFLHQLPLEEIQMRLFDLSGKELLRCRKEAGSTEYQIPIKDSSPQFLILHMEGLDRSFKVLVP